MIGFLFIFSKNEDIGREKRVKPVLEHLIYDTKMVMTASFLDKYEKEKLFINKSENSLIFDGYILNEYKGNYDSYITDCIENNRLDKIKGSFCGCYYDKVKKTIDFFVDPINSRGLFYFNNDEYFIVSENLNYIVEFLNNKRIRYTFDVLAAKYMISYGAMLDDTTYICEIKRVLGGQIFRYHINNNKITKKRYKLFTSERVILKKEKLLIAELDNRFKKAVWLGLNHDNKYLEEHLIDLSGGLDSRTENLVAQSITNSNITNFSFSQTESDEYITTMKMSHVLKNKMIFMPLDNYRHMFEIDEIVKENYGLQYYTSISANLFFLKHIDTKKFGLKMHGVLGDMYEGSFCYNENQEITDYDNLYKFNNYFQNDEFPEYYSAYPNLEIQRLYTRGMFFGMSTLMIANNYIESYTPFGDSDFLDLCLSIKLSVRNQNHIFRRWLAQYYPKSTLVPYDKTFCDYRMDDKKANRLRKLRKLQKMLAYKFKITKTDYKMNNMNPMQYWYDNNQDLQEFIDNYISKGLDEIKQYDELYNVGVQIFKNNKIIDKITLMTVIAAYKLYFQDNKEGLIK